MTFVGLELLKITEKIYLIGSTHHFCSSRKVHHPNFKTFQYQAVLNLVPVHCPDGLAAPFQTAASRFLL